MKISKNDEQIEDLMMDLESADFSNFERSEQKAIVEDWLEIALDLVDHDDIGPWELSNLAEAIGALLAGLYGLSLISMRLALTVDEKSDDPWYQVREEEFAGVTIEGLRQGISFSRRQAVIPHPFFKGLHQ